MNLPKRILVLTCTLILLIGLLAGCWNRKEINELAIVLGIGIDKAVNPNIARIQLTAQLAVPEEINSQEGSGQKPYQNVTHSGSSFFRIIRGLTHQTGRRLYFPHNQVIILSREIAQEGVLEYLDFFIRDHEIRLTSWVLVSKGRAEDILKAQPSLEKIPATSLDHIIRSQYATSETSMIRLKDFASRLMSKTTAPIAPLVRIEGEKAMVEATAVFKQDKFIGELNLAETRGLLWVLNKVKSGIINVKCPQSEQLIDLEILKAESKITPELRSGRVFIKINVRETGNIGHQSCTENLTLPPAVAYLEKAKANVIQTEILAALEKAQQLNADVFGFGELIHQHYPQEWLELKRKWDKVFPAIEVELDIETTVKAAGKISSPAVPKE